MNLFPNEVIKALQYYVYRLIDPRNGETFYIGKGQGNRVFQHANNVDIKYSEDEDATSLKIRRIREIKAQGFEVTHIIHRHGLDNNTALEVEAALIDAYPGLTNIQGGIESDDRGIMHSEQILQRYEAEPINNRHKALAININRSKTEREDIYESVRYAWRLNPAKAKEAEIVLAVYHGIVVGVFEPESWLEATVKNFPGTVEDRPKRWGFVGHNAPKATTSEYLGKKAPPFSQNPVHYLFD